MNALPSTVSINSVSIGSGPRTASINNQSSGNLVTSNLSKTQVDGQPLLAKDNGNNGPNRIKCAVCHEPLVINGPENGPCTYRMLAVRPSIGSGSNDPFFPILETLTHTSAVHVPCCLLCSDSLLQQWNEYETKNILIKNRVYKIPVKQQEHGAADLSNMVADNNHRNNHKTSMVTQRIIVHPPVSLSSNGNLMLIPSDNNSNSNSTTPSPQDEVLDLSITGVHSKTDDPAGKMKSRPTVSVALPPSVATAASAPLNLAAKVSGGMALLNVGTRPCRNTSSSDNMIATISPYSINSSMTNLIKVSTSSVALNLKPAFHSINESGGTSKSAASASIAKRPLLSCSLCDQSCPALFPVMLKPMGNCPYFPTLTPYVKMNCMASTGKIGLCESCHHQLMVQWDVHQKNNKPIMERQYQLVRHAKANSVIQQTSNPETVLSTSAASNSPNLVRNSAPAISQSFVSIVAANKTFICVMCGKDLISPTALNSSSPVAFSVSTENDTTGSVIAKKLIVQSAQEINLLPLLQSSTTPTSLQQLQLQQLLNENGRVLICSPCFETISSRCNVTPSINDNASTEPKSTNRSWTDNGIAAKTMGNTSASDDGNLLCLACNQHKYQYLVETKENSSKKPFFPFLHDPNEPNGRARLCAPCHLMLETQWDAYENSYVPYNQRVYRLPSSSTGQSTIVAKRAPVSSSSTTTQMNGQPPPLKIQISVPAVGPNSVPHSANTGSLPSDHLLLTTVNSGHPQSNHSSDHRNELIFKLMNDFLTNLGGPHPNMSGPCAICNQHSSLGETYQIYATCRNIILSNELGIYPYFPMLKHKKSVKNCHESVFMACTYCYHSLIAQWAAYHVSTKSDDRDLGTRYYNCRDFVCYVCGVTTYRQFVRSILVKEFPFLHEHKRPQGSLLINKGESVVTCLPCCQTLTHQLTENERMKVPLEMRKYNWMAVPPPPPSPSKNESEHKVLAFEFQSQAKKNLFVPQRHSTVIPILTNTTPPYQLNANSINHNGIISVAANSAEIIPKAIIVNAPSLANFGSIESTATKASNLNVVAPTFNPSHTLAPLVAAAIAATPVTIKQESTPSSSETVTTTPVNTTGTNTGSFADVLRQLARQQHITVHKINDAQASFNQTQPSEPMNASSHGLNQPHSRASSINLTTLASVAALAGTRNPSQPTNMILSHAASKPAEHSELPKAVINPNSFAIHFNAPSNNGALAKVSKKTDEPNCAKSPAAVVNNVPPKKAAQLMELEELISEFENYDKGLSKINIEVMKLREKRIAHLNKIKENQFTNDQLQSDVSEAGSAEIDESRLDVAAFNLNRPADMDSIVGVLDQVIPVLELNEKDSTKTYFVSLLGLATHRLEREREVNEFIQRKLNRRLSKASFKVDQIEENEYDILMVDPQFESFRAASTLRPSDISPDSDCFSKEIKSDRCKETKNQIMTALGLALSSPDQQMKTEIDWFALLRNRQMRRKRQMVCIGKTYNNLSDQVLNAWIPKLSSKASFGAELNKRFNEMIPLNNHQDEDYFLTTDTAVHDEKRSNDASNTVTIECDKSAKTIVIEDKRNLESSAYQKVNASDNQQSQPVPVSGSCSIGGPILNSSGHKILNTKQFAQEFHESVLLETQKQINGKQNSAQSIVHMVGPSQNPDAAINLINSNAHTIIYSDHLRPPSFVVEPSPPLHHPPPPQLVDRNGVLAIGTPTVNTLVKAPDKVHIRDQMLKIQHRINDLNREHQMLSEKKFEIIATMQKLESEKNLYQTELERLSKCLDL